MRGIQDKIEKSLSENYQKNWIYPELFRRFVDAATAHKVSVSAHVQNREHRGELLNTSWDSRIANAVDEIRVCLRAASAVSMQSGLNDAEHLYVMPFGPGVTQNSTDAYTEIADQVMRGVREHFEPKGYVYEGKLEVFPEYPGDKYSLMYGDIRSSISW